MSLHQRAATERLWTAATWPFILGVLSMMTCIAFESFAVTTVLPVATADIDGTRWYALAYAGTITTGLIGMVVGGTWADHSGTRAPLVTGGALFVLGIVLCALAPNITTFIGGRLLQGIGGGIDSVVLYVLIARRIPEGSRPKMFGLLTAAWLLPSMVGPLLAGQLTELTGWRTVFGLVAAGAAASLIGLVLIAHEPDGRVADEPRTRPAAGRQDRQGRQASLAVAAGGSLLMLHLGTQSRLPWSAVIVSVALTGLLLAGARLLPDGTLRLAGAPQRLLALRALLGSVVATTDVYLTLYLQSELDLRPTIAGLVIAVGAAGWAIGAWAQGQWDASGRTHHRLIAVACPLVALGPLAVFLLTLGLVSIPIVVLGCVSMGAGMGIAYPRISTATLQLAPEREQGRYSSALQAGESMATAALLAVAALVIAASPSGRFTPTYALLSVMGAAATLAAVRRRT